MSATTIELEVESAAPAKAAARDVPAPPINRLPQNRGDRIFFGVLTAAAFIAPALLVLFVLVLLNGAWPAIKEFGFSFLTSGVWEPNPEREQYGALPFIVGTLISSILALAIAGR